MNHILVRIILWVLLIAGIIVAAILMSVTEIPIEISGIIGGVISMAGIVFALIFLRCPHCQGLLNMRGLPTQYCSHCGESL